MNIIQRIMAPTPRFFRLLRNAGLVLTAASAAVITAPVIMPEQLMQVAGYLAMGGSVLSTVSQMTVESSVLPAPVTAGVTLPAEPPGTPAMPALPVNGKGKDKRLKTKDDLA